MQRSICLDVESSKSLPKTRPVVEIQRLECLLFHHVLEVFSKMVVFKCLFASLVD